MPLFVAVDFLIFFFSVFVVNIGGLFVLERWITPNLVEWGNTTGIIDQYSFSMKCAALGVCDILKDHWYNWYSQKDFDEMKKSELNSIRLPVGYWYFEEISGYTSQPYLMPKESIFSHEYISPYQTHISLS